MKSFFRASGVLGLAVFSLSIFMQSRLEATSGCCWDPEVERPENFRSHRIDRYSPCKACMLDVARRAVGCIPCIGPIVGCGYAGCYLCKLGHEVEADEPENSNNHCSCLIKTAGFCVCGLAFITGLSCLTCTTWPRLLPTVGVIDGEFSPLVCAIFDNNIEGINTHYSNNLSQPVTITYWYNLNWCTRGTSTQGYRNCYVHSDSDRCTYICSEKARSVNIVTSPLIVAMLVAQEDTVKHIIELIKEAPEAEAIVAEQVQLPQLLVQSIQDERSQSCCSFLKVLRIGWCEDTRNASYSPIDLAKLVQTDIACLIEQAREELVHLAISRSQEDLVQAVQVAVRPAAGASQSESDGTGAGVSLPRTTSTSSIQSSCVSHDGHRKRRRGKSSRAERREVVRVEEIELKVHKTAGQQ